MLKLILFGILSSTYSMVTAKRMPALIRGFRYQSFFLFLVALITSWTEKRGDLYVIAGLLFILKVITIPFFVYRIIKRIKTSEDLGLFVNPQLSLVLSLGFTYLSWIFIQRFIGINNEIQPISLAIAFSVIAEGLFLMISRMSAIAQIIGLLVMENGLFLFASSISGGMPFFVEIAIFFDVFVSVLILGVFVYRINKLFTHIDVNKLSRLKG